MFVIHKMSSNFSLFSTSLRILSKPSISSSSFKQCFSVSAKLPTKKLTSFAFYSSKNHEFCTSAAVASPESTRVDASDDGDGKISENLNVGNLSELRIKLPTNDSSDTLLRIRHTCAHVMAMAVQKLYPNAKVTIGPWIDNGFYYDFDMDPITDKDLKRIKKEMERIIGRNFPLVREEVSRDEAQKRIAAQNEPYKLEILDSIKEEPITIYHIGDEWWDLCAGPHVESTGTINRKAIELESVAGAYWRGDVNKPMLQRIYGTAWENEEQLKAYLHFKEEALRRDHRRLGQDLDLFSIQECVGVEPSSIVERFRPVRQFISKKV